MKLFALALLVSVTMSVSLARTSQASDVEMQDPGPYVALTAGALVFTVADLTFMGVSGEEALSHNGMTTGWLAWVTGTLGVVNLVTGSLTIATFKGEEGLIALGAVEVGVGACSLIMALLIPTEQEEEGVVIGPALLADGVGVALVVRY